MIGRNRLHYETTRINRPTTPATSTAFVLRVDAARASSPRRVRRASWRVRASSPRARVPRASRAPHRVARSSRRPARRRLGRARTPRGTRARRFARSATPTPRLDARASSSRSRRSTSATDDVVYLGLHGQAADWSGGMAQRFRATRALLERDAFDGYASEYLGLLHRDAEGVGTVDAARERRERRGVRGGGDARERRDVRVLFETVGGRLRRGGVENRRRGERVLDGARRGGGTAVGVWVEEGGESVFDDGRVGEGVRVSSNEIRGWRGGNARATVAGADGVCGTTTDPRS